MTDKPESIEKLLLSAGSDAEARNRLWNLIYSELRSIAERQLSTEAPQSLEPEALVHEAYMRLFADEGVRWENIRHFFGAAARAMRGIRVDSARNRHRLKRGGGRTPSILKPEDTVIDSDPAELLAVDEALERLESVDPRDAPIDQLRYFAGLNNDEIAQALGISPRTADYSWRFARAWLHMNLADIESPHDVSTPILRDVEPEPLTVLISPGSAPDDEIADLLAEISKLYRLVGGSGISFNCTDVTVHSEVAV